MKSLHVHVYTCTCTHEILTYMYVYIHMHIYVHCISQPIMRYSECLELAQKVMDRTKLMKAYRGYGTCILTYTVHTYTRYMFIQCISICNE